jgi:hypothetical protein
MKDQVRFAIACLLIGLGVLPACADQIDSVFYDNRFGAINSATGAFSPISTLPITQSAGIADDNGTLFAQSVQSQLITIDPVSGLSSIIGNSGLQLSSVGFAGGLNGLFEVDSMSNLYSINSITGVAMLVGATGLAPNYQQWDTSLSDSGTSLYFTGGGAGAIDQLYQLNPNTGLATYLGSTGVTGIAGSAIADGYLELFQYNAGTNHIYVAPLGSSDFVAGPTLGVQIVDGGVVIGTSAGNSGQSLDTPEPFSSLLFASGLFALGLWAREKNMLGLSPYSGQRCTMAKACRRRCRRTGRINLHVDAVDAEEINARAATSR